MFAFMLLLFDQTIFDTSLNCFFFVGLFRELSTQCFRFPTVTQEFILPLVNYRRENFIPFVMRIVF